MVNEFMDSFKRFPSTRYKKIIMRQFVSNSYLIFRLFGQNILCVGNEIGRLPPQFGDASKITNAILNSGFEYDVGKLYFNRFK